VVSLLKGINMDVLIHKDQQLERWREGVMTRMRMSALLGGRQLCSNLENTTLHVRATLAAPIFEASYGDRAETSHLWTPDHFDL
jgi:hypothetical protein